MRGKLGLVLFGTGLALLIAEAGLRVAGVPDVPGHHALRRGTAIGHYFHCFPKDWSGEFAPAPDVSDGEWHLFTGAPPVEIPLQRLAETPFCVEYVTSPVGAERRVRGPVPAPEERPGVTRILGVGDSFTFGWGVPMDLTLPRQLELALAGRVEVVNAARSGADTLDEVATLAALAAPLHARRALIVFVPNDIPLASDDLARSRDGAIDDLVGVFQGRLDGFRAQEWYWGHSRLVDRLVTAWTLRRVRAQTVEWYLGSADPARNAGGLARLQATLTAAARLPGTRSALVIYPLLHQLASGYPLVELHARVAALARAAGLPVLDLEPAFRGHDERLLWVHPGDHHPNGRANLVAARAIAEWVRRDAPWMLDADGAGPP